MHFAVLDPTMFIPKIHGHLNGSAPLLFFSGTFDHCFRIGTCWRLGEGEVGMAWNSDNLGDMIEIPTQQDLQFFDRPFHCNH